MTVKITDRRTIDKPVEKVAEFGGVPIVTSYTIEIYPETLARCQAQVIANKTRALIAAGQQGAAQKS